MSMTEQNETEDELRNERDAARRECAELRAAMANAREEVRCANVSSRAAWEAHTAKCVELAEAKRAVSLGFMDGFHLADVAAHVFAEFRTSKWDFTTPEFRALFRQSAVSALRCLWKVGDSDLRATVAARVAVWMRRDVATIRARVKEREAGRAVAA